MGSFSWRRADKSTKQANFISDYMVGGDTMKVLIPQEYVKHYGEYIKSKYYDYGRIFLKDICIDLYGLLAYMNRDMDMPTIDGIVYGGKIKDHYRIQGDGGYNDTNDDFNRRIGIALGCYTKDHRNCKYKLKICSPSYRGKYEDLLAFSMGDNAQGWQREYWENLAPWSDKTIEEIYDKECVLTEP